MKQTYQKPSVRVTQFTATHTILTGSVTGRSVYSTQVDNVSGFARNNSFWDDDEEYDD